MSGEDYRKLAEEAFTWGTGDSAEHGPSTHDLARALLACDAECVEALERAERIAQRDNWLAQQLEGCVEDARTVAAACGLATARALTGNLEDALAAFPSPADEEAS